MDSMAGANWEIIVLAFFHRVLLMHNGVRFINWYLESMGTLTRGDHRVLNPHRRC